MIDSIRKKFFKSDKEADMQNQETDAAALAQVTNDKDAIIAAQALQIESLTVKFSEIKSMLDDAKASLASVEQAKLSLLEEAHKKQMEARRSSIAMSLGDSKVDALMEATAGLNDVQFSTVIGAMAKAINVESESKMFREVGVTAEQPPVENDAVKRLEAKIAAQYNLK